MKGGLVICPGCGVEMPPGPDRYDGYFNTNAECWSLFTEVQGVQYQHPSLRGIPRQLTVDGYAVHHAGGPHPDKSVDVHLVGLHLVLEQEARPDRVPALLKRLVDSVGAWPHFPPPEPVRAITILDLAMSDPPQEHARTVRRWAEAVWVSWAAYHPRVRELARAHL